MAIVVISRTDGGGELLLDSGAAMPEQGIVVGAELRVVQTWYSGAAVPSVQILGTKEAPIPLKGLWRDDLLDITGGAMALVQQARAIFLSQAECSLQWIGNTGETYLSRVGRVAEFEFTPLRADCVRWSLSFQVDTSTESEIVAIPAVHPAAPFDLLTLLAEIEVIASDVLLAATLTTNVLAAVL